VGGAGGEARVPFLKRLQNREGRLSLHGRVAEPSAGVLSCRLELEEEEAFDF